jgi:FtsP/CotA-like multicopper oxidase with cupredoxin domain
VAGALPAAQALAAEPHGEHAQEAARHSGDHGHIGTVGTVDPASNGFDPHEILRDFDEGVVRNGVREWELVAEDREIEVAPGVKYAAWTYNKRVPGPTLRAREGERLRVRFVNASSHPHTIHFHGIHTARMDGIPGVGAGNVEPGNSTVYEFDAEPFGLHLYHCHSMPLADHIAKGLYGAFVIQPKKGRPPADELVMVMNGFDTNFDRSNEIYAVNTVAFAYQQKPIRVKRDELVRIYLVNALEFDLVNSFHIHANFFHHYPTGTSLEPTELTDTIVQGQGQRGILELRFPYTGKYMFHAHVSEFAELGWMGFFEVV